MISPSSCGERTPYKVVSVAYLPGNVFEASARCIEMLVSVPQLSSSLVSEFGSELRHHAQDGIPIVGALGNGHRSGVHEKQIESEPKRVLSPRLNSKVVKAVQYVKQKGPIKGLAIARHIRVEESTFRTHYVPKLKKLGVVSTEDGYVYVASDSENSAT